LRTGLLPLILLVVSAQAQAATGWVKKGSSLLLYDKDEELVSEIGLETTEEGTTAKPVVHEILGGAAKSGRFAWTLDRRRTYNADRTKLLASKRMLKVLGSGGEPIWTSTEADAIDDGDPVAFSDDGETLLASFHSTLSWRVAAKGYLGNTLMDLYNLPELESIQITPNGKYAMIRWTDPDKSDTHTFLNIPKKARRDVPSGTLHLGRAKLAPDGQVSSGGKVILDLSGLMP
jgi:hypothetical protein